MSRIVLTLLLCLTLSAHAASEAQQLTTLVQAALAERDYDRAQRLAVTSQHHLMIAEARAEDKQAKETKRAEWRKQFQQRRGFSCYHSGEYSYCN